jgi:hypothetical protein
MSTENTVRQADARAKELLESTFLKAALKTKKQNALFMEIKDRPKSRAQKRY